MPERPSERAAQNRVEEWPSVVPARGFSMDSVFGVGSNPVAPTIFGNEPFRKTSKGFSLSGHELQIDDVFKHCTMVDRARRNDGTPLFAWRNVVQIPSPVLRWRLCELPTRPTCKNALEVRSAFAHGARGLVRCNRMLVGATPLLGRGRTNDHRPAAGAREGHGIASDGLVDQTRYLCASECGRAFQVNPARLLAGPLQQFRRIRQFLTMIQVKPNAICARVDYKNTLVPALVR
jgi:hypothetical protein